MNLSSWLFLGFLLFTTGVLHAEGECPPGMFPTNPSGAQGPVGCAPIPGYNQQQQQAQPQQHAPPPQWATQWGAIATDSANGALGAVTGLPSKSQAQQSAMADCQTKGGAQCKLQVTYDNECAAMVVGNKIFNVGAAENVDKAIQLGMAKCRETDTNCHVYYSACSLPVRIQ